MEFPTPVEAATKVRVAPASFDDHFGQPRLFWLSLSPVEREHVIAAYTFELSKVYEQTVKERALTVLANIDAAPCAEVATGLGLPAPEPGASAHADVTPSPALSQTGATWPTTGRVVGIVADATSDLDAVRHVRDAARRAGLLPLLVAPTGEPLAEDLAVRRTRPRRSRPGPRSAKPARPWQERARRPVGRGPGGGAGR
ncbi:catalase-related domain-containing protein [Kitasatospora sp. NPDC003701]